MTSGPSHGAAGLPAATGLRGHGSSVDDRLGRALRDLRVSVTDRCNFRCTYCMPREVYGQAFRFLPHDQLLTFEEIARLARWPSRWASARSG